MCSARIWSTQPARSVFSSSGKQSRGDCYTKSLQGEGRTFGSSLPVTSTKRRCISMRKKLIVPRFKNETDEARFWANLDLSEYFEPSDFKRGVVFPSLKRTKRLISIRLPEQLLVKV